MQKSKRKGACFIKLSLSKKGTKHIIRLILNIEIMNIPFIGQYYWDLCNYQFF